MDEEFEGLPIVPHGVTGVDCCGCIVGVVEGKDVELRCNECGAVVGVVQADILGGLLGIALRDGYMPALRANEHISWIF